MKKIFVILFCAAFLIAAFPTKVFSATNTMKVSTVDFTETGNDTYKVSWKITQAPTNLNVKVFLSVSDHDYEAQAIELGSIRSGSEGSLSVTIPDIDSGYYHFMIGVTTMSGTITYAFSKEAIFFDNTAGAAQLKGITAGRCGNTVYAVWNDETPAILYLYDAKTKELLATEYGYDKPLQAVVPSGHKDVYAGVAAYDGTGGRFTPILCPVNNLPDTYGIFLEESITNQPELNLAALPEICRLYMNGKECDITEHSCTVTLEEGDNKLIAFVTDGSGYTAVEEKELTLDTIPPELTIESPGTSVNTTKKQIFIQGYAENGAFVTCDNEAVAMVGDCFSIEKEVPLGSHEISISASDKAGNSTMYTIEVNRSFLTSWLRNLILILAVAIAGIAVEGYLLIYRQRRRKKDG